MLQAVFAAEVGAGPADNAVARRVVIPPIIAVTSTIVRVSASHASTDHACADHACAYHAGAVRAPRLSTRNACNAKGRPTRAWAPSTDSETPPCSDQLKDSN